MTWKKQSSTALFRVAHRRDAINCWKPDPVPSTDAWGVLGVPGKLLRPLHCIRLHALQLEAIAIRLEAMAIGKYPTFWPRKSVEQRILLLNPP